MSSIGLNDLLHARLLAGQDGAPSPATVPDARCEVVPSLTDESCRPALAGEVQLQQAIIAVAAMSDDDFFDAADRIGLDPWSGMRRGRFGK